MIVEAERVIVAAERLHAASLRLRPILRNLSDADHDLRRHLERVVDAAGDYAFALEDYDTSEHNPQPTTKGASVPAATTGSVKTLSQIRKNKKR